MPQQRGWLLQGREGFYEDEVEGRQRLVTTDVLRAEQGPLPRSAAEALQLAPDSDGYILERVRQLDGETALFSVNYLPPHIGPVVARSDVPSGAGSLNSTLRNAGYVVAGASRTVAAVAADGQIASRLQVYTGTPVLKIKSTAWDPHLVAFDHHEVWVRSDTVNVEILVGTPGPTRHPAAATEIGWLPGP
jgi:GntR family transcriptional regulator